MTLSFEALLITGIFCFYLYDSATLAFSNELFFIESFGKWSASFPSERLRVLGKLLLIPNPATPFNLLFVATWNETDGVTSVKSNDMANLLANTTYLRVSVIILMMMMLILFPLVTYKFGLGIIALVLLLLIYLTIIVMLCYLYIKKEFYGLSKKKFIALAFESIACPPFALNMLRKLSLKCPFQQDPIKFAVKKLDADGFNTFKKKLIEKLSEQLDWENEEASPRSLYLTKYRKRLTRTKQ